jgi:hypothetical protein
MAQEKFKQACRFILLRHAPSLVKRMVFNLCILPCIRYPAGVAPKTLQQYRDLEKIPYQLLKQIYGLRLTFPQALIYTPTALGAYGEKSISDSIQQTKWKYLNSAIHLGGLAKTTTDSLIARGSKLPRLPTHLTDSLHQWAAQIGLTLTQHVSSPLPPQLQQIREILSTPSSTPIQIYGDGSFTLNPTTCLQHHLAFPPFDIRASLGKSATGITITHINSTGTSTTLQICIAPSSEPCTTTPLFHELLSISFASTVLPPASTAHLYSDNRQARKLGHQALATLAPPSHTCHAVRSLPRSDSLRIAPHCTGFGVTQKIKHHNHTGHPRNVEFIE